MKYLLLLIVTLSFTSCNTAIGMWRDTKQGFIWTKGKIQNSGGGAAHDPYGAPTY